MFIRFVIVSVFVVALAACTKPVVDHEAEGAALLAPLKKNLKAALIGGMESGPDEAISACNTAAPLIAGELSIDGVSMGRSSHKLRNSENVAPEWAVPFLQAYVAGTQTDPVAVELEKDRVGYVEPIMVQPMCLICHGAQLPPNIAVKIEELYPDDKATGFSDGDFRGIFWVEFPGT